MGAVLIAPKGLQRQPNAWTCGPAALRHALLCVGVRASTRRLAELAGIDRAFDGDTTPGLVRACREATGGRMILRRGGTYYNHHAFRLVLQNWTQTERPVLVCLDTWNHWVCVHDARGRSVGWLDSSRDDNPIERRDSWPEFLHRAAAWQNGVRWDTYPVCEPRGAP